MDSAVTFHLAATPADLTAFAGTLRGSLVRPGDAAYESERQVFNTALQGAPVAIARVADAGDVAATVGLRLPQRHRDRGPIRWPQPRRPQHRRRRHRRRHARSARSAHRPRSRNRLGRRRSHRRRGHRRAGRARHGRAVRRHRRGRHRRPDPRRRHRLAGAEARPGHRCPPGRGDRHGQRGGADRIGHRARRPVLGGARWRRQLRHRHPLPVPPLTGWRGPGRRAVPAADAGRPAQPGADRQQARRKS